MTGEEIVELLKKRRERLREEATRMYNAELERLGREVAAEEPDEVKPDAVIEDK